jgi:hypothetical protein
MIFCGREGPEVPSRQRVKTKILSQLASLHALIPPVIAAETGEIVYSDNVRIAARVPPAAIPPAIIRQTQSWTDEDGRAWQAIQLQPVTRDCQLFLTLRFCDDALLSAEFYANTRSQGFKSGDWTVAKELERKRFHDKLLSRWLGSKKRFPWGKVWSNHDAKGGFSTFGITYQANSSRKGRS